MLLMHEAYVRLFFKIGMINQFKINLLYFKNWIPAYAGMTNRKDF